MGSGKNGTVLSGVSDFFCRTSPRPEGSKQQSPGRKPGRTAGPVELEAWVVGTRQGGGLKVRENAE
jgi:hypothetical protein